MQSIGTRLSWHATRLLWGRGLGTYPRSSMLERPDMLSNPHRIHFAQNVLVRKGARLEAVMHEGTLGEIHFGTGTIAQFYLHVGAARGVTIGKVCTIAGRVYISDHDHDMPTQEGRLIVSPVSIGDGCWLGEGCAILKGVTLGDGCVVGANAVVTHSAPSGSILAGVPARIIKTR